MRVFTNSRKILSFKLFFLFLTYVFQRPPEDNSKPTGGTNTSSATTSSTFRSVEFQVNDINTIIHKSSCNDSIRKHFNRDTHSYGFYRVFAPHLKWS